MDHENYGTEELADAVLKKKLAPLRLLCSRSQPEDFPWREAWQLKVT